jgi:hypothetical protein
MKTRREGWHRGAMQGYTITDHIIIEMKGMPDVIIDVIIVDYYGHLSYDPKLKIDCYRQGISLLEIFSILDHLHRRLLILKLQPH